MARTKRIFISDIHLGARKSNKELFDPHRHAQAFATFFQWIGDNHKSIKDLVLLGDVFDTWACKVDETPPGIAEIIDHADNQPVIQGIRSCLGRLTNVFYLQGNHDMEATVADLERIGNGGSRVQCIQRYHAGLLYAEHGSRFAMFNAPDRMHDPLDGYPIGYYITRIVSSSDVKYSSPSVIAGYVDDILEAAFTSQKLAQAVLEAVMEMARLTPDTPIVMPRGRSKVTIRQIMDRYSQLYDRWVDKFGQWYAVNAIRSEMGSLGWFADYLCRKNGFRVVVMGHTHGADLDRDVFLVENRIYANSGYWCPEKPGQTPTFVEVDKQASKFTVRVWKVEGNDVKPWAKPLSVST